MKKITTKNELYVEFLKDLYSAKVHEISVLLFFERETSNPALRNLIHNHTGEVRMQVLRLEELIEYYDETISTEHCRSMQSMIAEAKELVDRCSGDALRDMAITASARRIKQCERLVYRMLIEMADSLGLPKEHEILEYNLREDTDFFEALSSQDKPVAD